MSAVATPTPGFTVAGLQHELRRLLKEPVLLMLTDNTRRLISLKHDAAGVPVLRAHKMFLNADAATLKDLTGWLRGKSRGRALDAFIAANSGKIRPAAPQTRQRKLRVEGEHYNLAAVAAKINRLYLQERSQAAITWGRRSKKGQTRSVRLGYYDPAANLISISRRLDKRDIPTYMLEYVIFHEMLHEVLGIGERPDGKRDIHGKMFKMMEATFPFLEEARRFEEKKWG